MIHLWLNPADMRIILHFNRRKNALKGPVEFEIYFSRTDRVILKTGVNIEKRYWDASTQLVKPAHQDAVLLNAKIKTVRDKISKIGVRYHEAEEKLTGDILRGELTNVKESLSLNEYIAAQLEYDRSGMKESSYRRYKSVLRHLNAWRVIEFKDCDTNLIRMYHNHLLKSMLITTTPKNHKTLSKYLKRAIQDGLITQTPYDNFRIPAYTTRKIYLFEEELESIRTKSINLERMDVVRDMFLFMCNTGMEYTDMVHLTNDNITEIDGRRYIVKNRMKVEGEIQAIPLFSEAEVIIKKYSTGTGRIFPARSNQRLNSYLKELATICGIKKPLTTIVARHTFATLMLTKGMPLESVSHILGHSNTKTTRIYAKLVVSKIDQDLKRLGINKL